MIPGHDGGRNLAFLVKKDDEKYVLRLSSMDDRREEDFLAEAEFIHYLAQHGAPVTDVIPSVNGKLVEVVTTSKKPVCACLFEYAKGKLLCENQYRYREGVPIEEYFYNTGKALGAIHRLSKQYEPSHRRMDYSDKYNKEYIDQLIPDKYKDLKQAILRRLDMFAELPREAEDYGLVHFDFSDGNYHIDFSTGISRCLTLITLFIAGTCLILPISGSMAKAGAASSAKKRIRRRIGSTISIRSWKDIEARRMFPKIFFRSSLCLSTWS